MMFFLVFLICTLCSRVLSQTAGSFQEVGSTQVSAMMMFVGNEEKVYIMDKVENNTAQINGHPAWAAEWDIATNKATLMPMMTNDFCAAGIFMPNGTWATIGGNKAIGPTCPEPTKPCQSDSVFGDVDGATAVRLLNPCTNADDGCEWTDNQSMNLVKRRWYPGLEVLADGSSVLIGGFVNGGYINRNFPNLDPFNSGAEPTFEFWPSRGGDPQVMQFMGHTSGLNAFAHAYLMPSGLMFVQANLSTVLWDYNKNAETPLPDMPNNIVRVYPSSAAVAMLPLTPDNNYTPTILFCGGISLTDEQWGSFVGPGAAVWETPTSQDCQRITPEPSDGSPVQYTQDDNMLEGRSMGQFVILPDETLLVVNGAGKGTAGYAGGYSGPSPFGESFSTDPVFTPAVYNPSAPQGERWSRNGFQASNIPRLYHSSAVFLPDTSVMLAGSNPNIDVNTTTIYPTTYTAERFYPSYFNATVRPAPSGIPKTLSYGGAPFDITLPSSSYIGDANTAAANTRVVVLRSGFSTHAMNIGQKLLRLNTTYTVGDDGTITLHVSQMPPFPNVYQPGPAFVHVVIAGIPSNGTLVLVGNGQIGTQPVMDVVALPPSTNSTKDPSNDSGNSNSTSDGSNSQPNSKGSGDTRMFSISSALILALAGLISLLL